MPELYESLMISFLAWIISSLLAFLYYTTGKVMLLLGLSYGYLLLVSLCIVKFCEKQSLVERFGFQRKHWLIIFISICIGVAILYYFEIDICDIDIIITSFIAPFTEETFYRGYMLGTIPKITKNKLALSLWLIFTSVLFSVAHIFSFIYNYRCSLFLVRVILTTSFGVIAGFIYLLTKTISLCFAFHMIANILVMVVWY